MTLKPILYASLQVVHKHAMGSCKGTLLVGGGRIKYQTSDKDDAFDSPLDSVKAAGPADSGKGLFVEITGGKRYSFVSQSPPEGTKIILDAIGKRGEPVHPGWH